MIMKSLFAIIFATLLFSSFIYSQDSQYFDAPFGGGGGYSPGWYFPNLDQVNLQMKTFGVPAFSNGGFYTSGGSGFIYLGFIPHLRVGGMGLWRINYKFCNCKWRKPAGKIFTRRRRAYDRVHPALCS